MSSTAPAAEHTCTRLLRKLVADPDDAELLHQTGTHMQSHPRDFAAAANALFGGAPARPGPVARAASSPWLSQPPRASWENYLGNQTCRPRSVRHPTSLADLVAAVADARAQRTTLRAVGSGHSYTDVALTGGILLKPQGMDRVLGLDPRALREPRGARLLFRVESGITIAALNAQLDARGLALLNTGAYTGQTLAGAISTGTHGTGAALGMLADYVRSLVLVADSGVVYQLEPAGGITDPARFGGATDAHAATLKQDDDWFHAAVVGLGCVGLVYSYTLEVTDAYFLMETRTPTTWEAVRDQLRAQPDLVARYRHFEVDVDPYAVDGTHACVATTRDVVAGPPAGSRGAANWLAGLLAEIPLTSAAAAALFDAIPRLVPWAIGAALATLKDGGYVAPSFAVLDLGRANATRAFALELAVDAASWPAALDTVLSLLADAAADKGWRASGPIGVRFVAPSAALLGLASGARATCTLELDMLAGTRHGADLLARVQDAVCAADPTARVHWGLEMGRVARADAVRMYGGAWERWERVYREVNASGMFNGPLTDRLGISVLRV